MLELEAQRNAKPKQLNIVIIGDARTGKTSLMRKFDKRQLKTQEQYPITESIKDSYITSEGDEVKVKLWDSKALKTLDSKFYQQADGVMLVFDLTN